MRAQNEIQAMLYALLGMARDRSNNRVIEAMVRYRKEQTFSI